MECYVNTINEFKLNADTLYSQQLTYGDFVKSVSDPATRYDTTFLNNAIANLSDQIQRLNASTTYPMLAERLKAGPILRSEYADFLIASGMTVIQIEYILRIYDPLTGLDLVTANYLKNLDTFYNQNFASQGTGGFCSIFTGLLDKLFSIFGAISGLISAINELMSIEQLLHKLIDTIKDRLLSMVQGLVSQISACAGSLIAASHKVRKVSEFFNDLNVENIKARVTEVIQNIGSKFEDLIQKPETIQYLIYRLCQLASAIEQFMRAPLQGLQDMVANCMNVTSTIAYNSSTKTLQAVEAGAFRLSPSAIESTRSRVASNLNNSSPAGSVGGGNAPLPERYITEPWTQDERDMAMELKSMSRDQIASGSFKAAQYLTFLPNVIDTKYSPYPGAGVKELNSVILMSAIRISKRLGKKLIVNSGFRDPRYQAELYANRGNSIVAKPPGPHGRGLAMDISASSFGSSVDDYNTFIKIASQAGVSGIGTYGSFIHIDVGSARNRSWGSRSAAALSLHNQDKFRQGTPPRPETNPQSQLSTDKEVEDYNTSIGGGAYTVDGNVIV